MKKVIILCLFLILSSCSNDDNATNKSGNNPFIGTWISEAVAGQKYTLQFKSDLTFYYSAGSQRGTYTVNGNVATINLHTTNNSTATIIDDTHINWVAIWTKQ